MLELIIEGNFIEIKNSEKEIDEIINNAFKAYDKNVRHDWRDKKNFKSDGYVYFYSKSLKMLPVGFLRVLTAFLESKAVALEYKITDLNPPTTAPAYSSIEFNKLLKDNKKEDGFFVPRYYQPPAIEACLKYDRGLIIGSTGSGKTEIAIMLCLILKLPTMILVERAQLSWQMYDRFLLRGVPEEDVGIFQSDKHVKFGKYNIVMVQSFKHFEPYVDQINMVLVDECHLAASDRMQEVLGSSNVNRAYGFSATPYTANKVQRLKVVSWLGFEIYKKPLKELSDEGFLAKINIRFVKIANEIIRNDVTIKTQITKVFDVAATKKKLGKRIKKQMLKCEECASKKTWRTACDACLTAPRKEIRESMRHCKTCNHHDKACPKCDDIKEIPTKDCESCTEDTMCKDCKNRIVREFMKRCLKCTNPDNACEECKKLKVEPEHFETFSSSAVGKKRTIYISPKNYTRKFKYVQTRLIDENDYRHRAVINIIKKHKEDLKQTGCLINFNFIEHGAALYKIVKEEFPEYNIILIDGKKTKPKERMQILADFEEKKYDIIVASSIWKYAIDITNVSVGINMADIQDIVSVIQWLGRGVRKGEKKDTFYYYEMFDFTNKTLFTHSKEKLKHYKNENLDIEFYSYILEKMDFKEFKEFSG